MKKKILIVTQAEDFHAYAGYLALMEKGADACLWHTSDFPARGEETVTFCRASRSSELEIRDAKVRFIDPDFDVVWNRRPAYQVDPEQLHPADVEFAERNCRAFRKSLLQVLCPQAFWVNPHAAVIREHKILQHYYAQLAGLSTPDTLYTNDPARIREFIREQGGSAVYKPLSSLPWRNSETHWLPYTSMVTENDLVEDDVLRLTPGIFQAEVEKDFEIRLTMMGHFPIAVKILSQDTELGRLDWRKSYHEVKMALTELPADVLQKSQKLMAGLGIVFGCFDFIVTPEGEYVFLEVNQMGQFLFLERYVDFPILDTFCEFLLSTRSDFCGGPSSSPLSYPEIEPRASELWEASKPDHLPAPVNVWEEPEQEA